MSWDARGKKEKGVGCLYQIWYGRIKNEYRPCLIALKQTEKADCKNWMVGDEMRTLDVNYSFLV